MQQHSWDEVAELEAEVVDVVDLTVVVDEADPVEVVVVEDHKVVHHVKETGIAPTRIVETTTLAGVKIAIVAKLQSQAVMVVEEVDMSVAEDSVEGEEDLIGVVEEVVSVEDEEEWTEVDVVDLEDHHVVDVEALIAVVTVVARWAIAVT